MPRRSRRQIEKEKKQEINPLEPPFPLCRQPGSFDEAFTSVAKILEGRKRVLVLAGAGISVSCGIPDFRSKDKGLYSTMDFQELGLSCPEELFDLEVFQEDPRPFYKFAKALYFPLGKKKRVAPSDSHRFLALLEQRKMLLRVYTQNIDGLEERAGVSPRRMVYAHGSLARATCARCKRKVDASQIEASVLAGTVARCQAEKKKSSAQPSRTGSPRPKRLKSSNDDDGFVCGGVLKPDITFFGETLQDKVRRCLESDRGKADALVVIGTSLSVAPMSKVIQYLPANIPRILINRTIVHPPTEAADEDDSDDELPEFREGYRFDAYMLGYCDDVTRKLVKTIGREKPGDRDGKLLANLPRKDEEFDYEEWSGTEVPFDRVLLFPGAAYSNKSNEADYQEIAHCDGCSKQIMGTIRKCIQCFDYDLCTKCYPKLFKQHFDGKHKFSRELRSKR